MTTNRVDQYSSAICDFSFLSNANVIAENKLYGDVARSYVYFAQADKFIKIGTTTQRPVKRIQALQHGCPHEINLLFYFPGDFALEASLQKKFSQYLARPDSEWYHYKGDLAQFINVMKEKLQGDE